MGDSRTRHRRYANIQYPYAEKGEFSGYNLGHDAVIVSQDPLPTLAFYRDNLISFLPDNDQWIGQHKWAQGDLHEFYKRLGVRTEYDEHSFWELYLSEMTQDGVLLHIAAQQAIESMKDL